jgi:hypothetical protein
MVISLGSVVVPVWELDLDRYRVSVLVCVSVSVWKSEWLFSQFWFLSLSQFAYADPSGFRPAVFNVRIDI